MQEACGREESGGEDENENENEGTRDGQGGGDIEIEERMEAARNLHVEEIENANLQAIAETKSE